MVAVAMGAPQYWQVVSPGGFCLSQRGQCMDCLVTQAPGMRNWESPRPPSLLCPSCGTEATESSKYCPACGSTLVRVAEGGDDYIGKILAKKYRVEAMIGEGGMGKVYRATQIALDKPVVLKVLRQSLLSDGRTVARFQREAKAASRLNHPNSISVLDFGQADDGALFIAMEYVAGKDLHQILSREWPLPEGRVVRIVSQVLSALADAHGAGVIHRDLKPENIMVEPRRGGETDFVKVLDFGIAKILDLGPEEGPALTRAGFVCGTPEYMSPEQARGTTLDHRSDLYAVGVILYQLTTGLLPFESDSAVGFATKHLTEQPKRPSERRPDARISPALEKLILRALSKSPDDRPQTAEAFKAELIAVDRERRASAKPRSLASPVLAPLPSKSPAAAGLHDAGESTQNTDAWGAGGAAENTVQAVLEPAPASLADRASSDGEKTSRTERTGPWLSRRQIFKLVTLVLLFVSMGVAGYVVLEGGGSGDSSPGVRALGPVPAARGDDAFAAVETRPLCKDEIPEEARHPEEARKMANDADMAYETGNLGLALTKYRDAFSRDPQAEYALKIGVLSYVRGAGRDEDAECWFARHLTENSDSKARAQILALYPKLGDQDAQPTPINAAHAEP